METGESIPSKGAANGKDRLERLHSGLIADVLDGFGAWGALDPSILCMTKQCKKVLARAFTIRWRPTRKSHQVLAPQDSTWNQVKDFLVPEIPIGSGMIYTGGVEGGLLRNFALAGGFSATEMQKRGFDAMILGGGIRDAHVVKQLDMPVWATNFTPMDTQGNYQVAEIGTWTPVGGVNIRTGDWLFADETGVLVIPQDMADDVLRKAMDLAGTEDEIDRRASSGEGVFDIVADVGHL